MRKAAARSCKSLEPSCSQRLAGFGLSVALGEDDQRLVIEFKDGVVPLCGSRCRQTANLTLSCAMLTTRPPRSKAASCGMRAETSSVLVFRALNPGGCRFFDDFHSDRPKTLLIAR